MTNTWFISDTHFGHKNIIEYEKQARLFNSVDEMNESIIENWNKVVRKKDVVYHLGDFAFGSHNIAIADRLSGRKKLILGNHDNHDIKFYLPHFEHISGAFVWKKCILTHIPIHCENVGYRFLLNLHGHLHSQSVKKDNKDDEKYFNVSCERNNLTPIHADVIFERLIEIKQNFMDP